ncbi:MAG: PASTA domain-containing protein [Prevotella sp.]|nr:PASTA domain-containing protein [Prevotella sp.]
MKTKKNPGKRRGAYVWGNLLAMAVVVVLLALGVKYGLDIYTHHGEAIVVPQLKGLSSAKALSLLEEDGLMMEVTDSGYNKTLPPDCVLAQTPSYGMKVKRGHVVYVTVNSPMSPSFTIPDIIDNTSAREAEARLVAMGFRLLPSRKVPGEKDWVYGILSRGRRVANGDRVPIEYPLTLLVGNGSVSDTEDFEYVNPSYAEPDEALVDEFEEVVEPPVE